MKSKCKKEGEAIPLPPLVIWLMKGQFHRITGMYPVKFTFSLLVINVVLEDLEISLDVG